MPVVCKICCHPEWAHDSDGNLANEVVNLESFDTLRASADQGCTGCRLFLQIWQYAVPETVEQQSSSLWFYNTDRHSLDSINIFADGGVRDIDVFTVSAALLPPTTELELNLPLIKSWLSLCKQNHPSCNRTSNDLPPRLLDVEMKSPGLVRVVETEVSTDVDAFAPYACLSHCWGKTRSKYLTKTRTIASNKDGIPVEALPQTFQDAINITRALELRYLWIDSLCIVQDDDQDWAMHVESMATIYANSYITLAAGSSEDDDGGFFTTVPNLYVKHPSVEVAAGEQVHRLYLRHSITHPDSEWPGREVLPLMTRGWTFQERLLSRRFLCFGSKEILWECLEDVACSCSATTGSFNSRDSDSPSFRNCPATKALTTTHAQDPARAWRDVVYQYSQRELTFAQDRLPALAGLASAFEEKYSLGSYKHGMWTGSLERDLAWKCSGEDASQGRPRDGPSWSWAYAADVYIEWPDLCDSKFYEYHGIKHIAIDGREETLEALSLTGRVFRLSLTTEETRDDLELSRPLFRRCKLTEASIPQDEEHSRLPPLQQSSSTESAEVASIALISESGEFTADFKYWDSELDFAQALHNVLFFPLALEPPLSPFPPGGSPVPDDLYPAWAHGLVLKPSIVTGRSNDKSIHFERFGWLRYCTEKSRSEFVLKGVQVEFLLV